MILELVKFGASVLDCLVMGVVISSYISLFSF